MCSVLCANCAKFVCEIVWTSNYTTKIKMFLKHLSFRDFGWIVFKTFEKIVFKTFNSWFYFVFTQNWTHSTLFLILNFTFNKTPIKFVNKACLSFCPGDIRNTEDWMEEKATKECFCYIFRMNLLVWQKFRTK